VVRLLFDVCHPVHVHLLRPVIRHFDERGDEWRVVARDKDVTLRLLRHYGISHVAPVRPGRGRRGQTRELVQREWAMLRLARRFRPHLIVGTSVHAARIARLTGARSVVINDDDASAVPLFAKLAYPLAHAIVTPTCLAHEAHGTAHLTYPANQQLFYLHPSRFTPDPAVRERIGLRPNERYGIVRLSALQAHHDRGVRGLDDTLLGELSQQLGAHMRLLVSSERPLPTDLAHLALTLAPELFHDALAHAELYLGDSQTATAEAAVLGVPAFRLNDFVGRISYLAELERRELAFGFRPSQDRELIQAVARVVAQPDRRRVFAERRQRLLAEMIDPLPWLIAHLQRLGGDRD
jgi:predicted glycosyltransferase